MKNLKQVLYERSHFPWNSIPQIFQSCSSIGFFHASYVFQVLLLLMHAFVSHY